MLPEFASDEDLLGRLLAHPHDTVYLVGSAVTAPSRAGEPGVPQVDGIIELIRGEYQRPTELQRFERALATEPDKPYQAAFRFLLKTRGRDVVNTVIRRAVLKSRTPSARFPSLPADCPEKLCRELEDDVEGWHLPPAAEALGRVLAMRQDTRPVVLTSNFDPLVAISVRRAGGRVYTTALHGDGSLAGVDGQGCLVVHFHGDWFRTDTLHTPVQLGQDRPKLEASLAQLVSARTLVVLGYSGGDDVFTRSLLGAIRGGLAPLKVAWTFHSSDEAAIANNSARLLEALRPGVELGRVVLYKGIDVHAFLPRFAASLGLAGKEAPQRQEIDFQVHRSKLSLPFTKLRSSLRRLLRSQCAFPGCNVTDPLEIAFISSPRPGGPRYQPGKSKEQLEAVSNFLLLCPTHHVTVDRDPSKHSIEWMLRARAEWIGASAASISSAVSLDGPGTSTTSAPRDSDGLDALIALVADAFTRSELEVFVRTLPDGTRLARELLGSNASANEVATGFVLLLQRHGILDEQFFVSLAKWRPSLSTKINSIKGLYLPSPQPMMRLQQGSLLCAGRYCLEELTASGGFGTLWRARDTSTGAHVAVKVLMRDRPDREYAWRRAMFVRGAKRIAAIRHECVAQVLVPHVCEQGYDFCIMEFVVGESLHTAVQRGRLSSAEQILSIILKMAAGLAEIHASGTLHGDVSPKNILVDLSGPQPCARLVDFDLACATDDDFVTVAATGMPRTDPYAAPEWKACKEPLDGRVDIFGLGMTTLFGLYAQLLPPSLNDPRVMNPSVFIESNLRHLPATAEVLKNACAFSLEERTANMQDFTSALSEAMRTDGCHTADGAPRQSRMEKTAPDANSSVSKGTVIVSALMVLGLMTSIIAYLLVTGAPSADPESMKRTTQPASSPPECAVGSKQCFCTAGGACDPGLVCDQTEVCVERTPNVNIPSLPPDTPPTGKDGPQTASPVGGKGDDAQIPQTVSPPSGKEDRTQSPKIVSSPGGTEPEARDSKGGAAQKRTRCTATSSEEITFGSGSNLFECVPGLTAGKLEVVGKVKPDPQWNGRLNIRLCTGNESHACQEVFVYEAPSGGITQETSITGCGDEFALADSRREVRAHLAFAPQSLTIPSGFRVTLKKPDECRRGKPGATQ